MAEAPAPNVITLRRTNTLTLKALTPYQLVAATPGGCYFYILNLGPGTLYVRYEAAPTGPDFQDPAAFPLPANSPILQLYVTGTAGLFVLADTASRVGVLSSLR
ncbi:MAG TPA: hypothetical protein VH157_07130 [Bryobacteraceae bacterium]|jgi:hypothetical protein|nr:hypothetical protein [Bryobacteraceae bacterium]